MLINSPNISGSLKVTGNTVITGSLTVLGGINATITGSATTASYVEYSNVANKPALVSGSSQITYSGLTGVPSGIVSGSSQITYSGISSIPSGIVSSSTQITGYNIFATTGSNQFNGSQAITGSLTVTGQVVAQTLNVQQVTSSIVYSSGSNVFGNSVSNTQQFTGSLQVSGSSHYVLGNVGISTITPQTPLQILRDTTGNGTSIEESNMAFTVLSAAGQSKISIGASNAGNYGYVQVMQDATSWTNRNLVLQPRGGNVGIGTYTPLDTFTDRTVLTINGTTNGAFLNFGSSGTLNAFIQSNTSGFQIGSQANIPVEIRVNGSNALVLAASGGAATFSSSVTATSFEVGNGQFFKARRSSSNLLIDLLGIESGTDNTRLLITGDYNIKNGSLATLFNMTTTGAATFSSSVTANGGMITTSANGFRDTDGTRNVGLYSNFTGGLAGIGTISNHDLGIFTNSSEKMRITAGGNVGIGETNPGSKLHVNGNIFTNGRFGMDCGSIRTYSALGNITINVGNLPVLDGNNWRQASIMVFYSGVSGGLEQGYHNVTFIRLRGLTSWNGLDVTNIVGSASISLSSNTTTGCTLTLNVNSIINGSAMAMLASGTSGQLS
jgi:hypothetical protein